MAAPLLYLLAWASLAGCASAGRRAIMRPGRSAALVYPGEPVPTPPSLRATNLHGLTDSSLWPAPISESHAASGDWVLLGSNTAGECGGPRAQHARSERAVRVTGAVGWPRVWQSGLTCMLVCWLCNSCL